MEIRVLRHINCNVVVPCRVKLNTLEIQLSISPTNIHIYGCIIQTLLVDIKYKNKLSNGEEILSF